MKNDTRRRARQRLDERLLALKPVDRFKAPPKGWVRAIRDALGMTGVQFGKRLRSKILSKADAAETEPYSVFFNVNGHFKRPSVIKPT